MKEMCNQFVSDPCSSVGRHCGQSPCAKASTEKETKPSCNTNGNTTMQLAQAYTPSQPYRAPMSNEQSLVCGTAFTDLVMPYCSGWHLYQIAKEG